VSRDIGEHNEQAESTSVCSVQVGHKPGVRVTSSGHSAKQPPGRAQVESSKITTPVYEMYCQNRFPAVDDLTVNNNKCRLPEESPRAHWYSDKHTCPKRSSRADFSGAAVHVHPFPDSSSPLKQSTSTIVIRKKATYPIPPQRQSEFSGARLWQNPPICHSIFLPAAFVP